MKKDQEGMNYLDTLALHLLQPYLPKHTYLPYTESSLSFHSIRLIANDIVIHDRNYVLEFGTGISTLILGALLDSVGSSVMMYSIDENEQWVNMMRNILQKEGIKSVQIIHSPLLDKPSSNYHGWYNPEDLEKLMKFKANLIIVDGPSAWQKDRTMMRSQTLPFLIDNKILSNDEFAIYLDDCNRNGEIEIIKNWGEKLKIQPRILNGSLGRIGFGDKFNTV